MGNICDAVEILLISRYSLTTISEESTAAQFTVSNAPAAEEIQFTFFTYLFCSHWPLKPQSQQGRPLVCRRARAAGESERHS